MTLFNDLDFKIMKLTLYDVQKVNYPSFHISSMYMMLLIDISRELCLSKNNI